MLKIFFVAGVREERPFKKYLEGWLLAGRAVHKLFEGAFPAENGVYELAHGARRQKYAFKNF